MRDVALIGRGYWGSKLLRYLEESPEFNVRYVCGSGDDLNEVWNDETIAAAVIATPNATHYRIVREALTHGKHVLSEKPLALTVTECRELRDIAREKKLTLLVEYTYTFSEALRQARETIEKGDIGGLRGIDMAVRHLGRFGGGSVYWLLASHMLSVLGMFVPLEELTFEKRDMVTCAGEAETGTISFRRENLAGEIRVSLNYPGKETNIVFYGEKGTIMYTPTEPVTLRIVQYERVPWTVADKLRKTVHEFTTDESNNLRHAVAGFHRAITGEVPDNADLAVAITGILEKLSCCE